MVVGQGPNPRHMGDVKKERESDRSWLRLLGDGKRNPGWCCRI